MIWRNVQGLVAIELTFGLLVIRTSYRLSQTRKKIADFWWVIDVLLLIVFTVLYTMAVHEKTWTTHSIREHLTNWIIYSFSAYAYVWSKSVLCFQLIFLNPLPASLDSSLDFGKHCNEMQLINHSHCLICIY